MRKILWLCLLIAAFAGTSYATSVTFLTPTGSSTGGGPVNASATVTTNANGSVNVVVNDLQANPTDVSQLISDFDFVLNDSAATTFGTFTQTASLITVNSNGTTTSNGTGSPGFTANALGGGSFLLTALGGGQPSGLIIGPPGPGGVYTNANNSIAGNGPHNPFSNLSASFTLNGVPGVTAATTVTSATFSFGTTAGVNIVGVPTPEPTTLISLGIGLLSIGGLSVKRRKKTTRLCKMSS